MVRKRVPEQHEGRRQEILAAAHRCFLRHGLQGASISMICKEAAMSPGHLYHYFPSKDAIIEQMADDYLASLHSHFSGHPEDEQTATVLLSELWSMKGWDDLGHCRILFELLNRRGGQAKQVREFRQIDTFGAARLFVRAQNAKGQGVQRRALTIVADARDDFVKSPWPRQFLFDEPIDVRALCLLRDRLPLLGADRTVCVGR